MKRIVFCAVVPVFLGMASAFAETGPKPKRQELSLSRLAPQGRSSPAPEERVVRADLDTRAVAIYGARYLRIQSRLGAIYVPALGKFSAAHLAQAFCAGAVGQPERGKVTLARAEGHLNDEVGPYADAVLETIQTKCRVDTEPAPPVPPNANLEKKF